MGPFKQIKLVAAAYHSGRSLAVFALAVGAAAALIVGAVIAMPSSHAASSQTPTPPLQACVLPAVMHHQCITPITKAEWQQKYHCTFCAVTMSDLEQALPNATPQLRSTIFNDLNGHMVEYGLDSPARLMNFFAQVEAETGKGKYLVENDNFSVEGLHLENYFRSHPAAACEDGRLDASDRAQMAACKELDPHGLHREWWTPHAANQRIIANRMYDGEGGNAAFPSDDGWIYRGRGLLQVTRRDNYATESTLYNEMYHPTEPVNFVTDPGLLSQPDYAFKASVGFWLGNRIEVAADQTDFTNPCPASDAVTRLVNGGNASGATKAARCTLLKTLAKNGTFGEVACHLPATPGPGQPPGVPLPPSPPMPPLPPVKPPSSSPPVGVAAHGTQPAPPPSSAH